MISAGALGYRSTVVADHIGICPAPTSIRSRWLRNVGRLSAMAGVWNPDWNPSL